MSILSVISRTYDELQCSQKILFSYWGTLEQQLLIICKPYGRLSRTRARRSKQEYMSHYRQKKAQGVYLKVLETYPHIFLPFLLAASPRACPGVDLVIFSQHLNKPPRPKFSRSIQSILEKTAKKVGIFESFNFRRLTELLFIQGSWLLFSPKHNLTCGQDHCQIPKPSTGADMEDSWTYDASDLDAVSDVFGKWI